MSSTQPPPPEGGGSYGGDPGFPGRPPSPGAAQGPPGRDFRQQHIPRPPSVRNAVRLMVAGAAISLISIIAGIIAQRMVSGGAAAQTGSDSVAASAFSGGVIGGVVFYGVVAAALWLWMAWKTAQGRHWSRIVSTVFAGLNVIRTAIVVVTNVAAGMPAGVGESIVQVASLIVGIVAVVLLWGKDANEFFTAHRPRMG